MSDQLRHDKPISLAKAFWILFIFLVIGIAMFAWSLTGFFEMIREIRAHSALITFSKGVYYLFGGGLFFIVMSIGAYLSFIVKGISPKRYGRIYATILLASLALVFVIPHTLHYAIEAAIFDEGYVVCEARSTQWLHARTIVYAKKLPCD